MLQKISFCAIFCLVITSLSAQVHTSYLWHLQQPNYWPEVSPGNSFTYQKVWESFVLKNNGTNTYADGDVHPENDLQQIFSKPDRVAIYQYRAKDAVQSLMGHPEGGAQVSYSGCLIENVNSLAGAGQWGYSNNWESNFITARNWTTSGGKPRLDMVGFTYHHVLSPLVSENVLRKQIQMHKHIYNNTFGTSPNYSKGFWPAECAFSERIIKVLVEEGFEWSVIANSHLARTLNDYPLQFGTSGTNYDPPNRADKVATDGNNWWNGQIDGRGGTFAAPYCYQAHNAKYVDPETGTDYIMTVVPMGDLLSYHNGFSTMGTGDIDANIAPFEDPSHPSIVLMAHDGDNAWGGGFDYYGNSVPGFANAAASQGYVPTTIQQFLTDHPVPANDLVRVEDGAWVNAANDWGHAQFINWIWPMYDGNHNFNPNGWTEDVRNWAVLTAAENHVTMAEDLTSQADISDMVLPNAGSTLAERAWHHLMPGYTSGYMYYGTSLDMEVKQTLAANIAVNFADSAIQQNPGTDNTPPSVFIPQRFPWNPGGIGFGPVYGYQQHQNSTDFAVWTLAYDVSGMQSVELKYRVDFDGENPLSDNENDTYVGGSGVGAWQAISMTERIFPKTNVTGNGDIDFFMLPEYIANQYHATISGLSDTLVGYYVEATDIHGNVFKTPIQHVYVEAGSGTTSPEAIHWTPEFPTENDTITVIVPNTTVGGKLHWGVTVNSINWELPDNSYWPAGSVVFGGGAAVQSPFTGPDTSGEMRIKIGSFNNAAQEVEQVDFVINYYDNSWDNNGGADYHIPITPSQNATCDQPIGAAMSNVTSTQATLNWTNNPNATLTQIQYRIHPNDGGGGNNTVIVGAGVTSKLLTNLTPGKQYQLRFRHNCDQGILSDWKFRAFITPASRLSTENEIYIFPNPFSGQLFLQFPTDFNGDAEVAVFDVLGNEVLRSALPDLTSKALVQIDGLEDWASDVYFVRLEHEGKFWSWKVVK